MKNWQKTENGYGFLQEMPADRPMRVLQLTDMQTVDLTHIRNATRDRQIKGAYFKHGVYGMEERTYAHVRTLVRETQPDLILLTGDNVYGEFDDAGLMLRELIELMESFGIPWAPVFGNHDNESRMGVNWQCEQLKSAPHCLFVRGAVTGNSNYAVYLTKNGVPAFALAMLDSNGCHNVGNPAAPEEGVQPDNVDYDLLTHENGIYPDQVDFYRNAVRGLPNAVFLHIQIHAFYEALQRKYGYTQGTDVTTDREGDVGFYPEHMGEGGFTDPDHALFEAAKAADCRAVFAGHQHKVDSIVRWQGVTLGYGLKTGYCTYWRGGATGGTLHEISADGSMKSTHVYRI
ncbi:MAG: hypothetical protein E7590_03610 [Ruminococcaceae bacterium]|nr:hypothetical protein [Oscillospiraceae bacterium]